MAREDTLVHELSQRFLLEKPIVETTAYDAVKDTVLKVLREMFSRHPEYTYVPDTHRGWGFPDLDKTRIVIWQEYPYDTLFLPCITLNMGSMKYSPVSFNQNMATVDYLHDEYGNIVINEFGNPVPNYYEYAGAWDSSLSININAQSPWDRDLITDFVKINMIHVYRDWLYTRGVFVKSVTTSAEGQAEWRNQHIYKLTLTCDLYSEWTHRIPVPRDYITAITETMRAPISSAPLVPEGGIVDGETVEDFATIIDAEDQTVRFFNDDKPENAMATIEYDETENEWLIVDEYWAQIARYFDTDEELAMLQTKYSIDSLAEITIEIWFDILSAISSPMRIGYLQVIQDVQVGINEAADSLGVDPEIPLPDGYASTEYNRLIQLREIKGQLEEAYEELVKRPPVEDGYGYGL